MRHIITWVEVSSKRLVMQTNKLFKKQYRHQNYVHVHVVIIISSRGMHVLGTS